MNLGQVIRRLREKKGWSQEELAHRVGTTAANLSRIETGKHGASETLTVLLARELGMKVYQLIALAEGVSSPRLPGTVRITDKDEDLVLGLYRAMPRDHKELYKAIGRLFAKQK
jgi:transcriptional regulator with XRE-family HTH domain